MPTGGTVINNGDSVLLDRTTVTTASDLDLSGGSELTIKTTLAVGGDFDFQGAAHVVIDGGNVTAGDDLKMDNEASTFKMLGGSFENGVSDSQDGYFAMTHSASRLEISGGSFIIDDRVTIAGTLEVIGDSATRILFCANGQDNVTLNGTVELVLKDGGITTIEGGAGNVALSGTLDVTLDPSFKLPTDATDYDLVVAGTAMTTTFDTVNLPSDDWSLSYTDGTTVLLSYVGTVPPGTLIFVQ